MRRAVMVVSMGFPLGVCFSQSVRSVLVGCASLRRRKGHGAQLS